MFIETNRCLIRRFDEKDIDEFMVYRNNDKWMQYQGFKGLTKQEYIKELLGDINFSKGVQLAIINKSTDNLIGDIYLKKADNAFWIGYTISPSSAKQGYAYETVNGIIDWIKETDSNKIYASTLPENIASMNLLKKLGFDFVGKDNEGENLFVMDLLSAQ